MGGFAICAVHESEFNKEMSFQRRSANCRSKSDADIVDRRDTYLDPLKHIQLELLERYPLPGRSWELHLRTRF